MQDAENRTSVLVRIVTLFVVACVMALGAIFVLDSSELAKVTGEASTRQVLVLAAPLAGLALTNFSMFSRSSGQKDFVLEILIVSVAYCLFLAITLPFAFRHDSECKLFGYFCEETSLVIPTVSTIALVAVLASAGTLLWRRLQKVFKPHN
ncbi:hypothetical protein [Rhodovulum marinum]|uniref:hypothetical protein n=1 Tax=Rhodovulum marinum TaxID=320662 RepID=UPI00104C8BC8|nr:hypothetical protein [Rhodovulum marinum]